MIKVLIVDDESWNRDIIKQFGNWEAYSMEIIGEAEDGNEALQIIERNAPQMVITDMRMPGFDGVQLLGLLNERYPDIKVIVVSGYDDFAYTKQAIRYKASDYLLKPIDPKELNAVLLKCKKELDAAVHILLDLSVAISLSSIKQMLRARFNELNKEGVLLAFAQLSAELEHNRIVDKQQLKRVIEELLLFLRELLEANSLELDESFESTDTEVISSPAAIVHYLSQQYLAALDQLIQQRKFKNKLNLEEIRKYMEQHFAEPLTLEQLARAFFVSKEYLSKMFKLEYGRNFTDYILQLRMDKAKEWLADESIPIKSIAEMTGYEDVTYFYRVFKKHFGIAPGEMRKGEQV